MKNQLIEVKHQFKNEDFYIPNWKIKYLFLGTFNPSGGEMVNYFYGRSRNQTWPLLSHIFGVDFNLNDKVDFFNQLRKQGIACMDIIDTVIINEVDKDKVVGKGYKDGNIINKKVKRLYNTDLINETIEKNSNVKVFTTWGKGSELKEWRDEISKVNQLNSLVSPSMAARVPKGMKKYEYMLDNWKSAINND
ncbi:MAG: hypothetical protein H6584_04815 [Flavobacteriales bacterium]|nr:hypothetical protein [Flavobacteriales bacterium]